jgi:septum formation protein
VPEENAVKLVLASASPRRRELLAQLGVQFEVIPSADPELDERPLPPRTLAETLAREKALSVFRTVPFQQDLKVLGADTVVAVHCDGAHIVLNKPKDRADARRMLRMLSGRKHSVFTGHALISGTRNAPDIDTLTIESVVHFRPITEIELESYLDTDEPYDKAGAYGIQGLAGRFVERLEGEMENVMGLSPAAVKKLLGI